MYVPIIVTSGVKLHFPTEKFDDDIAIIIARVDGIV